MILCRDDDPSGVDELERRSGMGRPAFASAMIFRGEGRAVVWRPLSAGVGFAAGDGTGACECGGVSDEVVRSRRMEAKEGAGREGDEAGAKSFDCVWLGSTSLGL